MPISTLDIAFYKSLHTVSSTDQLGGGIGAALTSQYAQFQPSVVTGCYISSAQGNLPGAGVLTYNSAQQTLTWRPPQSVESFTSPVITSDGSYTFGTLATGMVTITYTFSALPTTYKTENITIVTPIHSVFDQVTTAMALLGDVQYRCTYIRNNHPTLTASEVRAYIYAPPESPQMIELGVDPAGVGDGTTTGIAQTIANKTTAPAGVSFSAPVSAAAGVILGALPPNKCIALWQKRTVPQMSYGQLRVVPVSIGVTFLG